MVGRFLYVVPGSIMGHNTLSATAKLLYAILFNDPEEWHSHEDMLRLIGKPSADIEHITQDLNMLMEMELVILDRSEDIMMFRAVAV